MPPRRGPSGGWGRLRPVELDPLDVYGLPSKGETRLLEFKTQEHYYTKIIERYLALCTDAKTRDGLQEQFARLSLTSSSNGNASAVHQAASPTPSASSAHSQIPSWRQRAGGGTSSSPSSSATSSPPSTTATTKLDSSKDLSDVLMALRKLREAIVASKRADDFATQAYLFCIRIAVMAKQPEAYHPAILHLLRFIHRRNPLSKLESTEVIGYLVLDAACRRGDLAEAYRLRTVHRLRSESVDTVLAALAHDDWVAFRALMQHVDGHQIKLMEFAEHDMRILTLKCFGRAYLRLEDVGFLETSTGISWEALQKDYNVGWEREGKAVIIRKIRPKKTAESAS